MTNRTYQKRAKLTVTRRNKEIMDERGARPNYHRVPHFVLFVAHAKFALQVLVREEVAGV